MATTEVHTPQQRQLKMDAEGTPMQVPPMIVMNGGEMPVEDALPTHSHVWTTPTSHAQSGSSIHDGFSFCDGELYNTIPSWDSPTALHAQTPSDTMSRPTSMHQDLYSMTSSYEHNNWLMKPYDDSMELHSFENDLHIGQAYTSDEAIPILDLRYNNCHADQSPATYEPVSKPRRMSGSSFTMSTSGALSEIASYDDFSAAMSEATPSLSSDYPSFSNRNSLMSSTQLSPVASPRMTPYGRNELVRTHSRGRATSPSPRPNVRSAPYNLDSTARNKRWSTGTYGSNAVRRPSPFIYNQTQDIFGNRMVSNTHSPTISSHPLPLNYSNLQAVQHNHPCLTSNGPPPSFRNSMILPSQMPSQLPSQPFNAEALQHFDSSTPLLSHGLFRMLQSNADPHALHGHYADLSDPPDLYACLGEEQLDPPPEDMNPEDPDMIPHEQELRFEGDLYTPKWVRGHGNKREGWCGICKPGRWLVLKNSAYWYDKSFSHGISAATGNPFQEPQEKRRMDGNPDVWEGLCGSCNDWIALVSSKKKGTTWFRHAYKCHAHPKAKDGPKRRREGNVNTPTKQKADASPLTPTDNHPSVPNGMVMMHTSVPAMSQMPPHLMHTQYVHTDNNFPPLDGMQNMI